MSTGTPPVDVRIEADDGRTFHPLDGLRRLPDDDQGLAVWRALFDPEAVLMLMHTRAHLRIGVLPGRTALVIGVPPFN